MPNLITDVHTTDATVVDVKVTAPIRRKLAAHGVKRGEHYLDFRLNEWRSRVTSAFKTRCEVLKADVDGVGR
ncbi:hypothetical protein [Streptomyces sp. NPDC060035]|uniref:hypothetical protein n=1 Tax=Streptomyces sp. NPDC060035 TaxID=3347044 RepID=UPI0036CC0660